MIQSPILGAMQPETMKRTISVLDQDYDLCGLSRNNADKESDWILEMDGSEPLEDEHLNTDLVNKAPHQRQHTEQIYLVGDNILSQ